MSLSQIFVHIHLFNFYFFIFTHFRGWGDDLFQLKKLTRTLARCKDKFSQLSRVRTRVRSLINSQVTHSSGLKMNFKENKTAKSYFSLSLASFLGFWGCSESFLDHLPKKRWRGGWSKNSQNGSQTTQKTRKGANNQLKYNLAVLFSLKFIFNSEEWVTCDKLKGHSGWKGFYFYFLFVWSPSFSDHCICTVCLLFHKVR